jgi:NhaP-type Na+/H+ or K+/H+ antiporter
MAMLAIAGESDPARLDIFIVHQLGFGAAVGGAIGFVGGWLLQQAGRRGGITAIFLPRAVVALPVLCFVLADAVAGSMFIAAFVAGLAVRARFPAASNHAVEFAQQWGELFNLAIFFLFGILLQTAVGRVEPEYIVYGFLSLTLIRMLPVAIALLGSGVDRKTVLFVGWFGPRGLASIVLLLVFLEQDFHTPGEAIINGAVVVTVLLSIVMHGLSARPGIAWYAARDARAADK